MQASTPDTSVITLPHRHTDTETRDTAIITINQQRGLDSNHTTHCLQGACISHLQEAAKQAARGSPDNQVHKTVHAAGVGVTAHQHKPSKAASAQANKPSLCTYDTYEDTHTHWSRLATQLGVSSGECRLHVTTVTALQSMQSKVTQHLQAPHHQHDSETAVACSSSPKNIYIVPYNTSGSSACSDKVLAPHSTASIANTVLQYMRYARASQEHPHCPAQHKHRHTSPHQPTMVPTWGDTH